jgi:hypothetical protein
MVFVHIENNCRVPHCLKLRRDDETDLVVRERRALAGGIPHRCNTPPFRHCERNWLHANAVSSRRSGKFRPPSLAPFDSVHEPRSQDGGFGDVVGDEELTVDFGAYEAADSLGQVEQPPRQT